MKILSSLNHPRVIPNPQKSSFGTNKIILIKSNIKLKVCSPKIVKFSKKNQCMWTEWFNTSLLKRHNCFEMNRYNLDCYSHSEWNSNVVTEAQAYLVYTRTIKVYFCDLCSTSELFHESVRSFLTNLYFIHCYILIPKFTCSI